MELGEVSLIKLTNVIKTFGEEELAVHALNNINLHIIRNEYVVVMGPSGAGKSTLINILAGLDDPSSGSVFIKGELISSFSDSARCDLRRTEIGIIFQFFNLHPRLTVSENIELPLVIAEVPKKLRFTRITRVLDLLGLHKRRNHYPFELSGGERQRTAIARALVMKPSILLADEPTGDLDSETGENIIDLLHEISEKEEVTVIQVTHDEEMLRVGDRLIQLEDGKIISDEKFITH